MAAAECFWPPSSEGLGGLFKFKQELCLQLNFTWMLNTQKSGPSFQMTDFRSKRTWALDLEAGLCFKHPSRLCNFIFLDPNAGLTRCSTRKPPSPSVFTLNYPNRPRRVPATRVPG